MPEEMKPKPCPFCGKSIGLQLCDGEGNLRGREYLENPCSGIGFQLIHEVGDGDCPIATHDGETLGSFIYDSEEDAIAEWNSRAPELGTSVIRWTRYDGTPETSPDPGINGLVFHDDHFFSGCFAHSIMTLKSGDLWAYLPESPEEMA